MARLKTSRRCCQSAGSSTGLSTNTVDIASRFLRKKKIKDLLGKAERPRQSGVLIGRASACRLSIGRVYRPVGNRAINTATAGRIAFVYVSCAAAAAGYADRGGLRRSVKSGSLIGVLRSETGLSFLDGEKRRAGVAEGKEAARSAALTCNTDTREQQ